LLNKPFGDISCPTHLRDAYEDRLTYVYYAKGRVGSFCECFFPDLYWLHFGCEQELIDFCRQYRVPKIVRGRKYRIKMDNLAYDLNNFVATRLEDDKVFAAATNLITGWWAKSISRLAGSDYVRLSEGMNGRDNSMFCTLASLSERRAKAQQHVDRHKKYYRQWVFLRRMCTVPEDIVRMALTQLESENRFPHLLNDRRISFFRRGLLFRRVMDWIAEPAIQTHFGETSEGYGYTGCHFQWDLEGRVDTPLVLSLQLRFSTFPQPYNVHEPLFCHACVSRKEWEEMILWAGDNRVSSSSRFWDEHVANFGRSWQANPFCPKTVTVFIDPSADTQPYSPTPGQTPEVRVDSDAETVANDLIPCTPEDGWPTEEPSAPLAQSPDVQEITQEDFDRAKKNVVDLTADSDTETEPEMAQRDESPTF
jgi:hypothetical protein